MHKQNKTPQPTAEMLQTNKSYLAVKSLELPPVWQGAATGIQLSGGVIDLSSETILWLTTSNSSFS